MTALDDLMLILRLLLDYLYAKAMMDEAFDYAPHNDTAVLAQSTQKQ